MSQLLPATYDVEIPNPKSEEWMGIDRVGDLNYKQVDPAMPTSGLKAAIMAAKGETRSEKRTVALRQGKIIIATGPQFEIIASDDSVVREIAIKGCIIKNQTNGTEYKFVVTQEDGTQHVFKPLTDADLRAWLLDMEAVFNVCAGLTGFFSRDTLQGVHAPPPQEARLYISHEGVKVLRRDSDEVLSHFRYDKIKKFQCVSERTVMLVCQPAKLTTDIETYYRSLEGRGREIVALITEFVKDLVARQQREEENSHRHRSRGHKSSSSSSASSSLKKASSHHKKKDRKGGRTPRSARRHTSDSSSGSGSEEGELHPDWKPAAAPNGKIYYYNVITKETTWSKPLA